MVGFIPKHQIDGISEPLEPYYTADFVGASDYFGKSLVVGDRVSIISGVFINRYGRILDTQKIDAVWVAAVAIADFGTRIIEAKCLQTQTVSGNTSK